MEKLKRAASSTRPSDNLPQPTTKRDPLFLHLLHYHYLSISFCSSLFSLDFDGFPFNSLYSPFPFFLHASSPDPESLSLFVISDRICHCGFFFFFYRGVLFARFNLNQMAMFTPQGRHSSATNTASTSSTHAAVAKSPQRASSDREVQEPEPPVIIPSAAPGHFENSGGTTTSDGSTCAACRRELMLSEWNIACGIRELENMRRPNISP
jgi:hypothetical protein